LTLLQTISSCSFYSDIGFHHRQRVVNVVSCHASFLVHFCCHPPCPWLVVIWI
jgi:hypothetical protein